MSTSSSFTRATPQRLTETEKLYINLERERKLGRSSPSLMAAGWVKSLHCKSRALEDVYSPSPKHLTHLIPSTSCRKSVQNIKDVIESTRHHHHHKPKPPPSTPPYSSIPLPQPRKKPVSKHPRITKPETVSNPVNRVRHSTSSTRPTHTQDGLFPTLMELPEGHPSRNVVEIIFHTSWSPPAKAFSGRIEMIFKVQNLPRTVTRFEEYREIVKSRAGSGYDDDDARCIADGNEVMRFHCLGPTTSGVMHHAGVGGAWEFPGRKGPAVCTFSGSSLAHESAGGGWGRRAMLVCRVIAGRVSEQIGIDSLLEGRVDGFDSMCGDNGELLVFDSRAVLPCFLIIYKL